LSDKHILVVGAGQAGLQAAETLRSNNFQGRISLYGDESYAPYHRPPLSKAWLKNELNEGQLTIRDPSVLERKGISFAKDSAIASICPSSHIASTNDGTRIEWDGLILATGATPRVLPDMPRSEVIHVLRNRRDATGISQRFEICRQNGLPVVVIGGGFIGLEVAASARSIGLSVTIIEAAERLLARVASHHLSDWYAALHRAHGVELILGAKVANLQANVQANARADDLEHARVSLADGRIFDAGLVVVGIGVTPNDGLAQRSGIECDSGIVVDLCGRTSAPDIVAAGDCTVRRMPDGSKLRLESVHNAIEQGRSAALALLGIEKACIETPWFWSDQYDVKLQIAGVCRAADASVVRGDRARSTFSIFHYNDRRLIAVDSINCVKDHMLARQLIGTEMFPTIEQAADPSFDLARLRVKASPPLSAPTPVRS
jgi:3-phenylpropionate/trans-cinnamate dioxygenase ferredoxin reductase subunit